MAYQARIHLTQLPGEGAEQRTVTDDIDEPRDALGDAPHHAQARGSEDRRHGTRHVQAVMYIRTGFFRRQGLQVIAAGDALGKLTQVLARQQYTQFRLPHEDDLQQFLAAGFEIGEQPHLLQNLAAQGLGFINNEHHPSAPGVCFQQARVQNIYEFLGTLFRRAGDVQFAADAAQEFSNGDARVDNQRRIHAVRQFFQQAAYQGGLAGAHFPGKLNEAAALGDTIQKVGKRFRMLAGQEQVARVRRDAEGIFVEAEISGVHGINDALFPARRHAARQFAITEALPHRVHRRFQPPLRGTAFLEERELIGVSEVPSAYTDEPQRPARLFPQPVAQQRFGQRPKHGERVIRRRKTALAGMAPKIRCTQLEYQRMGTQAVAAQARA